MNLSEVYKNKTIGDNVLPLNNNTDAMYEFYVTVRDSLGSSII